MRKETNYNVGEFLKYYNRELHATLWMQLGKSGRNESFSVRCK